MRGGTYGWHTAKKGYAFIGFTNTIANMPAWGATNKKLGNNPLVIALPYKEEAVVLDMAMSQYSVGALQQAAMKGEKLSVNAGFDSNGQLTNDPAAIIASKRILPVGYWKGAGLALLLDMLATILSGGRATHEISSKEVEYGLSQIFIAINLSSQNRMTAITTVLENIINDYRQSDTGDVIYPGERVLSTRRKNLQDGIPVIKSVWDEILML